MTTKRTQRAVEVQRPDGAVVEVLLDGQNVVAVDQGDGDDTID